MGKTSCCVTGLVWCLLTSFPLPAQDSPKHQASYRKKYRDPVLEAMRKKNEANQNKARKKTNQLLRLQKEQKEKRRKERKRLGFDFSNVAKPASLEVFQKAFFFPPLRQYLTGTCWCFSTTSFFESEVYRLSGRRIKLSEMFTVYHEYVEKTRRFVRERGNSVFKEASEGNAVIRIWREYGTVPADAYPGVLATDGRFDHSNMVSEMRAYLRLVKEKEYWDENLVLASVRLILDKYMGTPPKYIDFNHTRMTPKDFLSSVLRLNLDDYVSVMSTLSQPFYAFGEYEVEANWWHSNEYYNVPLEEFVQIIKYAIQNGMTVRLNGDVTEPGYNGFEDAAIVPSFDILPKHIDQSARELRFVQKSTRDDHDIHLVGYTRVKEHDWFLIKDSSSPAQHGKFKGYFFYREDYIKLKMLSYIVHQDAMRAVVKNFKPLVRASKSP